LIGRAKPFWWDGFTPLNAVHPFRLSMTPDGFSVTPPSQLIRPRSLCNAARIMGQRFSARFTIADLTVGGAS
jgi:hypothetical protein